ncbi:domain-containing protein [Fusarium coicis]|nr:domain-containing protein [Fusarium coicis]
MTRNPPNLVLSESALAALPQQLPDGSYDLSIEWLLRPTRPRENIYLEDDKQRLQREAEEEVPLDTLQLISEERQKELEELWRQWEKYTAQQAEITSNQPWIDICTGLDDRARRHFQTFLREYVRKSVTLRPCLTPEEYEPVQTIQYASTLEYIWSDLVRIADIKVIQPKRQLEPSNYQYHGISYSSKHPQHRNRTVVGIGKWIAATADEMGLQLEQTVEKKAISTEDLLLVLDTIWKDAIHIPCLPQVRLAFHTAVVPGGAGGWRPASLLGLKYEDVEIGLMRHPYNKRVILVAKIRIHHVKQRRGIKRDQRDKLDFHITFVPRRSICLPLFIARAFSDNAFYGDYQTFQDLQSLSLEKTVQYRTLQWKPEFHGRHKSKSIIPASYHQFRDIWNRTMCVMGMPENPRIYGLRVGAAGRLNGQLTPALRNYILSHSSEVFERSYHPVQLSEDIMGVSYKELAAGNKDLLGAMQGVCYKRDKNAPIYIKKEDLDGFYERKDIIRLRELQKDENLKKKATGRIQYIINYLEDRLLEQKRLEYFEAVKEGRETLVDHSATNPRRKQNIASSIVAGRIAPFFEDGVPAETLVGKLVAYLRNRSVEVAEKDPTSDTDLEGSEKPRCLICSGPPFHGGPSLARHVWSAHSDFFQNGFFCPECRRLGIDNSWIPAGEAAWSSHVERTHGTIHAPKPLAAKLAYCLLCSSRFTLRGFNQHFYRHPLSFFQTPFHCPECEQQDVQHMIDGRDAWIMHLREHHNGIKGVHGAILREYVGTTETESGSSRKRKVDQGQKGNRTAGRQKRPKG